MTKKAFISGVNAELKAEGFSNKIVNMMDNEIFESLLVFKDDHTNPLVHWLQNRFTHGVNIVTSNTIKINAPINSNK